MTELRIQSLSRIDRSSGNFANNAPRSVGGLSTGFIEWQGRVEVQTPCNAPVRSCAIENHGVDKACNLDFIVDRNGSRLLKTLYCFVLDL